MQKTLSCVFLVFLLFGCANLGGQQYRSNLEWNKIKKLISSFNHKVNYKTIIALLGRPFRESLTPGMPNNYILYFNVPNDEQYMYWIALDKRTRRYLFWSKNKVRKENLSLLRRI